MYKKTFVCELRTTEGTSKIYQKYTIKQTNNKLKSIHYYYRAKTPDSKTKKEMSNFYHSMISENEDKLFENDIEWVNDAINRLIKQHDNRFIYSQGFIDGLGSLIYNCGERGVTLTEFWNRWSRCRYDKNMPGNINQNDLNFTIAAVKTSRISAPGHIERRYDEHKLMLN